MQWFIQLVRNNTNFIMRFGEQMLSLYKSFCRYCFQKWIICSICLKTATIKNNKMINNIKFNARFTPRCEWFMHWQMLNWHMSTYDNNFTFCLLKTEQTKAARQNVIVLHECVLSLYGLQHLHRVFLYVWDGVSEWGRTETES